MTSWADLLCACAAAVFSLLERRPRWRMIWAAFAAAFLAWAVWSRLAGGR